jgi:hypothetical protein
MDRGRLRGYRSSPAFAVPHLDNRMIIIRSGQTTEEVLGDQTNYTEQLAALASSCRTACRFGIDSTTRWPTPS